VTAYRDESDRIAFRIELSTKPDPARLRILLDVDGKGHGEPTSGADYMLEGVNFYRYPLGAKGWQWTLIEPPLVISRDREIIYVLPATFHTKSAWWLVQLTDQNWATADEFPKNSRSELRFDDLPTLSANELAREVATPSLKITSVSPARVTPGGLAFTVPFAAPPDPARFRLMLDTDQAHSREPNTGADYMIEGVNFYRYPPGASNWTWNALAPPVIIAASNTLTYILLDAPPAKSVRWLAETTNPDWSTADRFPAIGKLEFKLSGLPELKLEAHHRPEDVSALTNNTPTLSCRFDAFLKAQTWSPGAGEGISTPSWEIQSMRTSLPLRVTIQDVVSGETVAIQPTHALHSGRMTRWEGTTTTGIHWILLKEPSENGDLWLTGELQSDTNRCLRVGVGCSLNVIGWTWHDDARLHRVIKTSSDPYGNAVASPCGVRGEQSLYPFGVLSSSRRVLIAETDPDEPRVFQVFAEPDKNFFGVYYDLGLSQGTKKFPGKATFRCALRSLAPDEADPFRRALVAFYRRNPGFWQRRVPRVGLWMPFTDISTIPHAQDFGFAFFEKEGTAGKDVDYCRAHGILTLAYTEPWLYWLPMPGTNRTESEAVRRMKFYAAAGNDQRSEFAAAALAGAVRKPDGSIRMDFMDVPWNSGARMEVSTDPEFPTNSESPINRAMSEWRHIQQTLKDKRYDGVYLDSMSAMDSVDYNPAALAVADYPCSYEAGVFQPSLATKIAGYEFIRDLGEAMRRRHLYLMGNFPCWRFPFYMKYIDIPGEETTWRLGGQYQALSDSQLLYRRIISGQKPYGFLQASNFDEFKGPLVERYFRDCLFWGFLPGFFSADGATSPYWSKSEWYERDRPLFKSYIPIIRRLAMAGWQPLGPVRSDDEALWIEHFGTEDSGILHITLRNTQPSVLTTQLSPGVVGAPLVLVNPLDGRSQVIEKTEKLDVALPGHGLETWDIVPISHLQEEINFVRGWNSGAGEAEACRKTLGSLQAELAADVRCNLKTPLTLVQNEDNPVNLEIINRNSSPIRISAWTAVKGSQLTLLDAGPKTVEPGSSLQVQATLRVETNQWLEIQWQLDGGKTHLLCTRVFKPRLVAPLTVICPSDKLVSIGPESSIELSLQNVTARPRTVFVHWQGDFGNGNRSETLAARSVRAVLVPVKLEASRHGALSVQVESEGKTISQRRFEVTFLEKGESLARDSRVRVDVDSTYSGYTTKPLADGVRDTKGIAWNEAAWASEETGGPHWVRIAFPEPTTIHAMAIYWNIEGGVTYTSRRGTVIGWTESGEKVALGEFTNANPVAVTRVEFPPRKLKQIELRQPSRGGSATRPNLLWLSEIEVR